ncbi:hypothetical protein WA026_013229 [Henosepilachna vigintioctopunctata]|uniref:Ubiquitin-like domain-containing protein n=1 Tax=Henosepilachna vigintioctopunctata TaxID=420089 RepID=A0AAW1UE07_9CUCU
MFRVRKIHAGPNDNDLIVNIPRNRTVAQLREYINSEWQIPPEHQKLYYQGKELVDGHKIIEYSIQRNHIIQLMVKSKNDVENDVKSCLNFESSLMKILKIPSMIRKKI